MEEHLLVSLAGIIIIGASAQWLAMRLKLPSILFLLVFGFIAGPVFNFIQPDHLFGDLLFPIVSLSVAIILFEGGMDLKLDELKDIGRMVFNLVSMGVLVSWILIALAAYFILHLELSMAILVGSMLVVTGPTVIGPLLRHIRPSGRVGHIVKWEGIMIDPVGVLLAVLVFEAILASNLQSVGSLLIWGIIKMIFLSALVGVLSAFLLILLLKKYWIPDTLHEVVTLMFIFLSFIAANHLQEESGLLAVTLMGIILANQKQVSVKHILEFKENLRVLIISFLFIILSARMKISDIQYINMDYLLFILFLIFVVRPVSVFISAWRTDLTWKEKIFISWIAPRGIVAAAMASIFAHDLGKKGFIHVEGMVPLVFFVIVVTVAVYGLSIKALGLRLGICKTSQQGVLILGAQSWARTIARKLLDMGIQVIMVDSNKSNVRWARRSGMRAYQANILQEDIEGRVDLADIGRLLCLTPNEEANALAAVRFRDIFGTKNVFQLFPDMAKDEKIEDYASIHLRGRLLFKEGLGYKHLSDAFDAGAILKEEVVAEGFNLTEWLAAEDEKRFPLFLVSENKDLSVFALDKTLECSPGQTLIYLSATNSDLAVEYSLYLSD